MTTPYELHGNVLRHREGSVGGPTFEIDWKNRSVKHEGEEVPAAGGGGTTVEEKLELKSGAKAALDKPK